MATISSSRTDITATTTGGIQPVQGPVIYNVYTSPTPSTETSFSTSTIKRFTIVNRGAIQVNIAYAPGGSGTNYITVYPGSNYEEDNINNQVITFYIQSPSANQRVEVVTWS